MGFCPKYFLLVLLIVAVILDIIAVAIPYWMMSDSKTSTKSHMGLWKMCVDDKCIDIPDQDSGDDSEFFPTSRGLHMFALIVGVITAIVYIVGELVGVIGEKIRKPLIVALSITAGAFILIANSYMAEKLLLYSGCHVPSLISAAFFIFVGGFRSSANGCIGESA